MRYLLDENVDPALRTALQRRYPEVIVWIVGDPGAPVYGTLDPDILLWCETNGFALVTNNRASMPVHLRDHLAAGHHVDGIFILNPHLAMGESIDDLALIWGASVPGEYADRVTFLPIAR